MTVSKFMAENRQRPSIGPSTVLVGLLCGRINAEFQASLRPFNIKSIAAIYSRSFLSGDLPAVGQTLVALLGGLDLSNYSCCDRAGRRMWDCSTSSALGMPPWIALSSSSLFPGRVLIGVNQWLSERPAAGSGPLS